MIFQLIFNLIQPTLNADEWVDFGITGKEETSNDIQIPLYIEYFDSKSISYYLFVIFLIISLLVIQTPSETTKKRAKNATAGTGLFLLGNHIVGMYFSDLVAWITSLSICIIVFFILSIEKFEKIIHNTFLSCASAYSHVYLSMIFLHIVNVYYFYSFIFFTFCGFCILYVFLENIHIVLAKTSVCTLITAILIDFFLPFNIFKAMHGQLLLFSGTMLFISKIIVGIAYVLYLLSGLFG